MSTTSHGQPILAAVPPPPINLKTPYATILNSKAKKQDTTIYETFNVPVKQPKNINGRLTISWSKKEIQQSILQTNLQYAVMGKFKYGNVDIHELWKVIPSQCGLKGECIIGLLETKVILIRCIEREDYINLLSTSGFWLTIKNESLHMRTLKWDTWQDSKKEAPIAMAWISLPNFPPNFFAEDFVKSIAFTVGKPMQADLATKTNSRPSCARVKVKVNLLSDLPDGVEVGEHDENENVISSKWIKIRYDYLPKYYMTCSVQGHDELECYSLHPQLYPKKNTEDKQKKIVFECHNPVQITNDNTTQIATVPNTIFTNGRQVFTGQPREEWQQGRKNKNGTSTSNEQTTHLWKTNVLKDGHKVTAKELTQGGHLDSNVNTFALLNKDDEEQIQDIDKEEGEAQLLPASDKSLHDKDLNVMGNIMNIQSTSRANQGIKSCIEEKAKHMPTILIQNELESRENTNVQHHVLSANKEGHTTRPADDNFLIESDRIIQRDFVSNKGRTPMDNIIPLDPQLQSTPRQVARHKESAETSRQGHNGASEHVRADREAQIRKNTKASVDNMVLAMTQLNHDCLETKMAYTVPSLSDKCVSPSQNSNALIPTQEIELMFKVQRLMKLHETDLVTLDIAKKLTKQEHQTFLKIMRDSGYLCTTVAKGTEEQATTQKERPPQQPKQVQLARSSKSNSTQEK